MVVENLANFSVAGKNWNKTFVFGFFISTVSLVTAGIIFPPASGLVALFLTSAAAFPLINKAYETEEDLDVYSGAGFLERHAAVLKIYSGFFVGVLVATSMAYFAVDQERAADIFRFQLSALGSAEITGRAAGVLAGQDVFSAILVNNLRVALVSFLVAVIFGAASVFIISWNASVIAVFIGVLAKTSTASFASYGLLGAPLAFAYGFLSGLGAIVIHGIPEIMSYFVAGLAGGVISVGITKEKLASSRFLKVFKDGMLLLVVAVFMIFVAAAVEAY